LYRDAASEVCHGKIGSEHADERDISKGAVIEYDATGTDDDRHRC